MRFALFAVTGLLLAGCVAEENPQPEPASVDPEPTAAPGPLVFVPSNASTPATDLSNLTAFHFGIFEDLEALVLEVRVDFGDDNTCELRDGSASGPGPAGPRDLSLYESDTGLSWSMGSQGTLASAHHEEVDTRSDGEGHSAGRGTMWGSFKGRMTLTYLGQFLEAGNDFVGGAAFTFSIVCDEPFAILAAQGGTSLVLVNEANLAGGTGAETPGGSVNLQDQAKGDFASPRVRAAGDGFGYQAATVNVQHPEGSVDWEWTPVGGEAQFLEGGPGQYAFTVDRAGAYFDAFWLAAWGLDGEVDLSVNQLDEALIESPFS